MMRWIVWLMLVCSAAGALSARSPVQIVSADGRRLYGELTIPDRAWAGVVIIHGSGPDGALDYAHQSDVFNAMGIATLAYDKRGWNKSGGDWHRRTVQLLAADANAAARTLRARLGLPVGYWGISQGGWVLARAGAADPEAAFLIGVAASGVSPFQQERWHKDQMMRAAGYPAWARRTADRYWSAALDLMIRLDRYPQFWPGLLEGERAGSSFGLAYDPAHDWKRTRAPLLLLYGTEDRLQPWFDSGRRIAANRDAGSATVVRNFRGASHAITRATTGLAFDWGEHDDPLYASTMGQFANSALAGKLKVTKPPETVGRWPVRPPLAAPFALLGLVGLPILLAIGLRYSRTRIARSLSILGFACWAILLTTIVGAIHPHGSFYEPSARFPAWGWGLPGLFVAGLVVATIALMRTALGREHVSTGICAAAVATFTSYWI